MDNTVREQILQVRDSGLCNMLDTNHVQVIADSMGLYHLVVFIEEHRKEYCHFIMYGN